VNWFERHAFGSHQNEWLAVALVVVLLLLALCVAVLRLALGLFKRKGNTGESESDYWRIHGG
jgi:hypothetical protein